MPHPSFDHNVFTEFCRNGRVEGFYQKLYPGLLLFASRHLGEKRMYAEDCVQNAVLKVWQRRKQFDSPHAFKAFMYVSIKNEIISIHRNSSARGRYVEKLREFDDPESFLKTIIDHEAKTILFNYINNLPQKEREVCRLSYIEGLSNAEITERLNISLATVKRHKARSLEILRTRISDIVILALILKSSL